MSPRKKELVTQHTPDCLTLVLISDTHDMHREVEVPNGDLLIHAGDFTMDSRSAAALIDFDEWLGELPHAYRVVIPGNHDGFLEDSTRRQLITNASLLINEGIEVMGLKIWGSPTTPLLGEAFGVVSDRDRAKLYSRIPADTDILVTHGPPYGILDQAPGSEYHAGCQQLLSAVRRIKPMLHVFGHSHAGYGSFSTPDTLFVNAALPGNGYDLAILRTCSVCQGVGCARASGTAWAFLAGTASYPFNGFNLRTPMDRGFGGHARETNS